MKKLAIIVATILGCTTGANAQYYPRYDMYRWSQNQSYRYLNPWYGYPSGAYTWGYRYASPYRSGGYGYRPAPHYAPHYAPRGGYDWSWGGGSRGYLGGRGGGWGGEW